MTAARRGAATTPPYWHARQGTSEWLAAGAIRCGDAFVFIVPLLLAIEFTVGGRLFLPEVVLLVALPFMLDDARRRGVSRVSHRTVILGVLWLFGLVVTDIYHVTPFVDYSRGWSKVAFFLTNFAALSLLIDGRWRRVTLFAAGLALGQVLQFYFERNPLAAVEPWKFGLGPPVTLACVLLASRPAVYRRPVIAGGILIALSVVNLKLGFRSLGGICFLAAVTVMVAAWSAHSMRLKRRALQTFATLAASLVAGVIIVQTYEYAAEHGVLGERAQRKYEAQRSSLGILAGRPEIIVATRAIRDSPIVGHGSWAKDPQYATALQVELRKAGYRGNTVQRFPDLIPTHSHLFGAWVEAGILGALFWLWALALAASVLTRLHWCTDGRAVFVAFLAVSFLWTVLFSPLGAEGRLIGAFFLVVLLLARQTIRAAEQGREVQ